MSKQTKPRTRLDEASLFVLASTSFDGAPRSGIADNPRCLGDVSAQQFHALVGYLLAMNDEQLFAAVAGLPQEMMEVGTACAQMSKWHRGVAEACVSLTARIACCVAKNVRRLDEQAA